MNIDFDELFSKEAFKNIDSERKEAFRSLAQNLEGKNFNESMNIILEFSRQMPKCKEIPPQEQKAMIETLMTSLPEGEKSKFGQILKMISIMGK